MAAAELIEHFFFQEFEAEHLVLSLFIIHICIRCAAITARTSTREASFQAAAMASKWLSNPSDGTEHAGGSAATEHAGGSAATEHACGVDAIEKRTARDGRDYSYQEFVIFYGSSRAPSKWHEALPVAKPIAPGTAAGSANKGDATEHTKANRSDDEEADDQRQAIGAATEHTRSIGDDTTEPGSSGASGSGLPKSDRIPPKPSRSTPPQADGKPVLLRVEDIEPLQRATRLAAEFSTQKNRQDIARSALESAIRDGCATPIPLDELFQGMGWREYIAWHKEARKIIGEGVVDATAETIQGVKDPNRYGQLRIDFVVYRADGSYCRLHPGSKTASDAKVRYFEAVATEHARGSTATEHAGVGLAQHRWTSLPAMPFNMEAVATIPQSDRIGKEPAYAMLSQLSAGRLPTDSDSFFPWWLFVANLGHKTEEVIDCGITAAELLPSIDFTEVRLKFTRMDQSEINISIYRSHHGRCKTCILT